MKVIVFSDQNTTRDFFSPLMSKERFDVTFLPPDNLESVMRRAEKNAFFYIDIASYQSKRRVEVLQTLERKKKVRYGIIDPDGFIKDIALLFHYGASDYIDGEILGERMTEKRIFKAATFLPPEPVAALKTTKDTVTSRYILSGNDWKGIKAGQEYTFVLMYVELDGYEELKKTMSDSQVNLIINIFKRYVKKSVTSIDGKVWIWNEFEGVILFPFDGCRCDAILACFRLMLSQKIFSIEHLGFNALFSFRIALHLGNTVYKRKGSTGTIVSRSVNTIFHIGRRFAEQGNFYLTQEVFQYTPDGLKKCFLPAGQFEAHEIIRMRRPQ
jgi:hypothetical protein